MHKICYCTKCFCASNLLLKITWCFCFVVCTDHFWRNWRACNQGDSSSSIIACRLAFTSDFVISLNNQYDQWILCSWSKVCVQLYTPLYFIWNHRLAHMGKLGWLSVQCPGIEKVIYLFDTDRADYICHRKWNDCICLHNEVLQKMKWFMRACWQSASWLEGNFAKHQLEEIAFLEKCEKLLNCKRALGPNEYFPNWVVNLDYSSM